MDATGPKVSVVIPTYNRAVPVCRAVESVLGQTFTDFEIIVVDDGSTDDTRTVLSRYGRQICYYYQENRGVSAARNEGIRRSRGQWIAFLDSDDIWYPNKLSLQMASVGKHSEVIAHTGNVLLPRPEGRQITSFEAGGVPLGDSSGVLDRPYLLQLNYGTLAMIPSTICRRTTALQAGLFNERFSIFEDYDFMCRIALQGKWSYSREVLARALRVDSDSGNLSHILQTQNAEARLVRARIYENLLALPELTQAERAQTRNQLYQTLVGLGADCLRRGNGHAEAMNLFKRACCQKLGGKAVCGWLLSMCPAQASRTIADCWDRRRRR